MPAFVMVGDGVLRPSNARPGYWPYLYLGNFAGPPRSSSGGDFSCVGAQIGTTAPAQTITTREGLRLGDPASRVRRVYGNSATFMPLPTTAGMSPRAGYVVHEGRYDLVFKLDQQNRRVTGIAGGLAPMTPSSCFG